MNQKVLTFFFLRFFQGWGMETCVGNIKVAWKQSQEDVGELMARNGDVAKVLSKIRNIVRSTCIEATSVQESVWN